MAEIRRFPTHARALAAQGNDPPAASASLLEEQAGRIAAIVFDEMKTSEREPGVQSFRAECAAYDLFALSNRLLMSGADDWRRDPAYYAALVLAYRAHKAMASFFLTPHFYV